MKERPKRVHAPITGFPVEDHCLTIGGQRIDRLAARVGRTPFYAYDRALMSERVAHLRAHLPEAVHIHYAIKANPMPAVVHHMRGLVDGFDVASVREMMVALDAGMAAERISFAGPGKTDDELRRAAAAGITVHLESETEMERLAAIGRELGLKPNVAVRVNPDFELKASGMHMGGGPRQFGVDAERVPQMLSRLAELPLAFEGFHIFGGSQNLNVEKLIEAQDAIISLALSLAGHAPAPVRLLNIGGGLGIPYFPGDQPIDLKAVTDNLARHMPEIETALPDAQVVLELGRYLVGEAGIYVCKVLDRKESRGQTFLITDGGLNHHLAASGNFGQVIRKNYPLAVGNRMDIDGVEIANVVGNLCTPLDLLGDRMELPEARPGDLVVIFQSGAYGLTASPTGFLSHPEPAEVLV